MPRFRDGVGSNGRVNVRIHPVSKARMMAYCEWRTREAGVGYSLSMLLNDYGWSLPPVAPAIEQALRVRQEDNGSDSIHRPPAAGRFTP
jgi:hypothetical protein